MTDVQERVRGHVAPSPRRTLGDFWNSRSNAFGLLRLVLATAVLVSHSWPLGFGDTNPLTQFSGRQTDLGSIAVLGFFVLSGFLVSASAQRLSVGRFLWHRFLRIYPGLWTCLLVIIVVIAPVAAMAEGVSAARYWSHPGGPFSFLSLNWTASARQYTVSGLLSTTPYGELVKGPSAFNGSWWSLRYEVICYATLSILAASRLLRRRWTIVLITAGLGSVLMINALRGGLTGPPRSLGATPSVPLFGVMNTGHLLMLTFMFFIGCCLRLYRDRIPVNPVSVLAASSVFLLTLRLGAFYPVGFVCFGYLMIVAAVCLPARTHGIGRHRDYSYGIYIYAFAVQQVVALLGGSQFGLPVYIVISFVGTVILAALSWHLIEEPAMRWKEWTPSFGRGNRPRRALGLADPGADGRLPSTRTL